MGIDQSQYNQRRTACIARSEIFFAQTEAFMELDDFFSIEKVDR